MSDHYDRYNGMENLLGTNLAEVGTDVPDINVGNLISRQKAIDALKEHRALYCDNTPGTFSKLSYAEKSRVDELDTAIATLVNLPSAEPKRGKWIRTGSGSLYDHYECSECGKAPKWECMGDNRWKIAFTDFCPNCGADMRGEP